MDKPADKAKKQMQSMGFSAPYMGSKETRTEKEVMQDRKTLAENVPILGEAMLAKEIASDVSKGNYTSAALGTAALGVGILPGGDILNKPIKAAAKSFRKKDIGEAEKLVDNAEKLQEWRDANRLPESQRQKNIPEAQQAAEDLFQGNITSKESRKRIKEVFPEPQLYTAETMPEMTTITDVVGSMGKKAEKGILGVKGFDLEPGQRVGARLDIPAYNEYDKWVVSIHDGKIRNGSVVGYGQAIRLKNIEFGSDPEVALDIAKGKRVAKKSGEEKPMGKATIARVFGDYVPEDPYELQEFARKVLADKDSGWTQVGMNPYRGSYFYNKETGNVVTRADEVIQIGPLVLAKNVTEPKLSELKELFSQKTARTKDGKIRVFNEGGVVPMKRMAEQMELFEPVTRGFEDGGLMDEGGTVDPVSGNEVPPGSTQEEVRDDIPAQLSEGEFVFPADVVRYFGLEKLMKMRQEAKMGLKRMEAMGQMGNSEEATMPDDLPFSIEDLDMEDEEEYNKTQEFARGGVVYAQEGTFVNPDPQSGVYYQPSAPTTTGVAEAPMVAASAPANPMGGYKPPQQAFTPVRLPQELTPTFQGVVGFGPEGVEYETVTYVNEANQTLVFKKNKQTGQLLDLAGNPATVPEGYKLKGEEEEVAPVTTQTTQVTGQGDGGREDDVSTEPTVSFGGTQATGRRAGLVDNAFSGKFSIEMPGVGVLGTAKAIKDYFGNVPSGLAYGLTNGKFGEQLSLKEGQFAVISDIKVPGTRATPFGQDRTLALDLVLDAETYNNMMRGNVSDRKEMEKIANFVDKYGENIVGSDDGRVRVNDSLRSLVDRVEEEEKKGNVVDAGRFRSAFEANRVAQEAAAERQKTDTAMANREKAAEKAATSAAAAVSSGYRENTPGGGEFGNNNNDNDTGGGLDGMDGGSTEGSESVGDG